MRSWFISITAAWSQGWNAFLGGNRDQSFSSRSWEAKVTGKWWGGWSVRFVDLLFGKGHCEGAFDSDDERTYILAGQRTKGNTNDHDQSA